MSDFAYPTPTPKLAEIRDRLQPLADRELALRKQLNGLRRDHAKAAHEYRLVVGEWNEALREHLATP